MLRELLERVAHFVGHVVGGAQPPAVAGVRLRPQAEGAQRRAAARGVERNERVQQERNVVARDVEIALVDLGDPGQRVQILDGRAFGVVDDAAVLAEADAGQLVERLALGVIDDLVIELAAHHEIDGAWCRSSVFSGSMVTGGPTKATFSFGFDVLHHLRHLHVDVKAGSGGEEHQQFEILGHLHGLLDGDLVRRRVHHLAVGQHAGRVAEPHRIPVRFDFARSRPARTGAAVETFERWRIQKQRSHAISVPRTSRRKPGYAGYWLSVSPSAARFEASMEKLLKSMVNSALPTSRVSTTLCTCSGTEIPSRISYFRTNATFLRKNRGALYQVAGFLHPEIGCGIDPELAFEEAGRFLSRRNFENVGRAAVELPFAFVLEFIIIGRYRRGKAPDFSGIPPRPKGSGR